MIVEVCCNSIQSAENAHMGGADRIELCQNLEVGGLTPDISDIIYCVKELGIRTHVLIRPREGDFCYTQEEFREIEKDVLRCKMLGVHCVVVGFLTPKGKIDTDKTTRIVDLAHPMEVTFHRAFDEIKQDPIEALEDVISSGCTRILTSGCHSTALSGIDVITNLVKKSNDRIIIMAGCGVTPKNAKTIIDQSGISEIHGSCKAILPNGTIETNQEIVQQLVIKAKS